MEYLNWVRDLNDSRDFGLEVKVKFDTCIEKLLEWHLDRENELNKQWVDSNFPKITGNLKDWTKWALEHERYNITLNTVRNECQRLAQKRFDLRAGFSPQKNRLQQNLMIAEAAKIYLIALITHTERDRRSDAAKWADEVKQARQKEIETLIDEVSDDSKEEN